MRCKCLQLRTPAPRPLALDTDQRLEPGDLSREAGSVSGVDNRRHILVGPGRFLRHTTPGWAANQDSARRELVDNLPTRPLAQRFVPAHRPPGAMACR